MMSNPKIKKMKGYCFLLVTIIYTTPALAQSFVVKTDTGSIKGANYKILFPPNWKGKLVMYAHGYEFMGSLQRQSQSPMFANSMKPF